LEGPTCIDTLHESMRAVLNHSQSMALSWIASLHGHAIVGLGLSRFHSFALVEVVGSDVRPDSEGLHHRILRTIDTATVYVIRTTHCVLKCIQKTWFLHHGRDTSDSVFQSTNNLLTLRPSHPRLRHGKTEASVPSSHHICGNNIFVPHCRPCTIVQVRHQRLLY
jgi:hypothetical protein